MLTWVLIKKFCEMTGYTDDAVRAKIKRGIWLKGVHYIKAPDGHILLIPEAINSWTKEKA